MLQEKLLSDRQIFGTHVPGDKLQNLVGQAIETLDLLLKSDELSAKERSEVALKILEIASASNRSASSQNFDSRTTESLPENLASGESQNGSAKKILSSPPVFIPGNYIQLNDFLSPEEYNLALEAALQNEVSFVGSTTTTKVENYRRSSVLYATFYPELYEILKKKILKVLPSVLKDLKHNSFLVSKVEMQLTAHNDGCFYKVHNDSGSEQTATREITYVYYFYREPKEFSGGELQLYDTELRDGSAYHSEPGRRIEPWNNSIVFFNSRCKHEVMLVNCPSQEFANSRFTLNGWIRRVEV
jgi:Rps23 Pro-64 3,4-dihydroxylase Tpa1-like proline 4-hydroxylase